MSNYDEDEYILITNDKNQYFPKHTILNVVDKTIDIYEIINSQTSCSHTISNSVDEVCDVYELKEGLNENNIYPNCFEFCKVKDIGLMMKMRVAFFGFMVTDSVIKSYCKYVWRVKIPDDEYCIDKTGFTRSKRIILSDCASLFEQEKLCEIIVKDVPEMIQYVDNRTEKICENAVANNGLMLQYVHDKTQRLCEIAICQNFLSLMYVENKTEKLCELAITQNPRSLFFISNITQNMYNCAIKYYGSAVFAPNRLVPFSAKMKYLFGISAGEKICNFFYFIGKHIDRAEKEYVEYLKNARKPI